MSMKNSSHTTTGNRIRDLPACSTVPQPTVPVRTPCYCVSTDIFPNLCISKQPLSLLTEFRATGSVCLSVFHWSSLQTVSFIGNNSKHVARSRVKNSVLSYRLSQSAVHAENKHIFTGIPDRCDSHEALHYATCLRPLWSKQSPPHIVLKSS
jgi:hypothetical protein